MFSWFKSHPFAVEAFFESSLVLTFSVPKDDIKHLIPECLELDTFNDKWAFIAVAMVQTKSLRPKGFPDFLGSDFFLVGYRVFVRFHSNAGRRLRGLYILASETDSKKMELLGNFFTHYNYTTTTISRHSIGKHTMIDSSTSGLKIIVEDSQNETIPLPFDSPFAEWKVARRFSGPLPFTFTYNKKNREVLVIEGVRETWKPKPVKIVEYHIPFIANLQMPNMKLASAFSVKNTPYFWKKGKIEKWEK